MPFDATVQWAPYQTLASGNSIVHIARTKASLAPGTHEFKATVDRHNQIAEKNEDNNSRTVPFTVK
jgi:subtilase family serine protease